MLLPLPQVKESHAAADEGSAHPPTYPKVQLVMLKEAASLVESEVAALVTAA